MDFLFSWTECCNQKSGKKMRVDPTILSKTPQGNRPKVTNTGVIAQNLEDIGGFHQSSHSSETIFNVSAKRPSNSSTPSKASTIGAEVTGDDIRHTLRDVAGLGIIFRMSAAVGEPGFIVDGFHTGCSAEVQRKVRIGMRLIAVNGIDVQFADPADVAGLMLGPVNSVVTVTMEKGNLAGHGKKYRMPQAGSMGRSTFTLTRSRPLLAAGSGTPTSAPSSPVAMAAS
mmetsp:Transcript_50521/g.118925  ORF Transcript_50521/g.118925 Transcript_50521/m.118925 type:complete len:227 (+) Transcript_50521:164-844(+)